MRIALDARLQAYRAGGISQYTAQLTRALLAHDTANTYLCLQMRRDAAPLSTAPNARRIACWTPCHHRLERYSLAAELWPHRADILHSPDFIPPAAGYRRAVITVHDLNFLYFPQFLTADSLRYYSGQIQWAVTRATRIIAVSQATRRDLLERLAVPPEKIAVVYEAAAADFQPLAPETVLPVLTRYGLTPGYLLFVGTLEPRKNLPGLLRAYAHLRAQRPSAPPLVLAGAQGWLADEIDATVKTLKLTAHVHFIKSFARPDLPALYNGARALAMPSHYEGFGLPVLEAMQCGVPVLISNRSSLPEIAGDAALSVPVAEDDPHDEALTHALLQLLEDDALVATLRIRGHARAAQFSWAQAARETLHVYTTALAT